MLEEVVKLPLALVWVGPNIKSTIPHTIVVKLKSHVLPILNGDIIIETPGCGSHQPTFEARKMINLDTNDKRTYLRICVKIL